MNKQTNEKTNRQIGKCNNMPDTTNNHTFKVPQESDQSIHVAHSRTAKLHTDSCSLSSHPTNWLHYNPYTSGFLRRLLKSMHMNIFINTFWSCPGYCVTTTPPWTFPSTTHPFLGILNTPVVDLSVCNCDGGKDWEQGHTHRMPYLFTKWILTSFQCHSCYVQPSFCTRCSSALVTCTRCVTHVRVCTYIPCSTYIPCMYIKFHVCTYMYVGAEY